MSSKNSASESSSSSDAANTEVKLLISNSKKHHPVILDGLHRSTLSTDLFNDLLTAHIRLEGIGDMYPAFFILVVLYDSYQGAPYRKARTV